MNLMNLRSEVAKALLGKKIGMTQVFTEDGRMVPVTAIEVEPNFVVQVKTKDKEGYPAIQIGYGAIKEKRVTKPMKGHFDKAKVAPAKYLAEVPVLEGEEYKVGQKLTVGEVFATVGHADVVGVSKGKGFAGVIKRHGFRGGPGGHGSHFHRAPGSVGMAATPSRVLPGRKLPGQLGNARVTSQNLEIVRVESEKNLILVKGAVPGANGTVVMVKEAVKKKSKK